MSLGDNTNQNKKQPEAREGITRLRFYNPNSSVDPSTYQVSYLFGMLVLKFSPMLNNSTPDNPKYDYENSGKIYLNHMDALIMLHEIETFLQDPTTYYNLSCVTNSGSMLTISNGSEFGTTNPCLVLRKFDDKGDIIYTYLYEFNSDRYSIRNFDKNTNEYDKIFNAKIEIEMLKITLEEYVKATTNAVAYSINDLNRYQDSANYNRMQQICTALGIEKSNGGNHRGSNAAFNGAGRNYSNSENEMSSASDIEDLL